MNYLSDDEILKLNPETDEIFSSISNPNEVIAMKISDNYCQFNIMNQYFREFKQVVKSGNLHKNTELLSFSYGAVKKTLLPNAVYVIRKNESISNQPKFYIGYNIDPKVNIKLIINTTNLTLAYKKFQFNLTEQDNIFNHFTYTIYEPTDAVEQAYRNLLKIPTLEGIADYAIRNEKGKQAGLNAEALQTMKEFEHGSEPNESEASANVFRFGGTKTQKKKRTQKKTNKHK
jgi:hypothetical protein